MLEILRQDVVHAARSLRRTPGFTVTAILTLALGIGATSAIFTVVNAALLRRLPYPDPDRVVMLGTRQINSQPGQLFLHLRDRARSVEHVSAQRATNGWNLVAGDVATYVSGMQVSAGYFDTLGVAPLLGRGFTRAETEPKGPSAVVISEALWRSLYGGRPDALGETLQLGGLTYAVVGVMPDRFRTIPDAEVWTPLITSATDNTFNYRILARVSAAASLDQARQEFDIVRPEIQRAFPRTPERRLALTTWTPLRDVVGASVRTPLLILLAAVAFVLMIACVNVAGLHLTRALGRRRELATRAALGGSRLRLARHVIAEATVLGLAGAAAGLAIAVGTSRLILTLVSAPAAQQLLSGETLTIDWRVFGFTLGISLLCSFAFGVVPALLSTRVDVRLALAEGATTTASRRTAWMRRSFAVAQVALSLVLLVGAGLLIRSLWNLTGTNAGFVSDDIVVGRMSLQGVVRDGGELESLLDRGLARIGAIPGVVAVTASNGVPVERPFNVPLEPPPGSLISEVRGVDWRYVTPDYFRVFRIRQIEGRPFDERDRAGAEPVAIVNEALARVIFGRVDVVGQTLALVGGFQDPPRRIVGVVDDVKAASAAGAQGLTALGMDVTPMLFTPAGQASATLVRATHGAFAMTWSIRTDGQRPGITRDVQDALRAVDARLPFVGFEPMAAVVARDVDLPRLLASLLAAFAALATTLAAIGLYSLMAYSTSQRVREVGIRMAVGATTARLLRQFMREGLAVVSVGMAAGAAGAALSANVLASYLFGVRPLDSLTFATVAGGLLLTAALACLGPAMRAARLDPVRALKTQ
jgi:putative ABC transport system permease protein